MAARSWERYGREPEDGLNVEKTSAGLCPTGIITDPIGCEWRKSGNVLGFQVAENCARKNFERFFVQLVHDYRKEDYYVQKEQKA